MGSALADYFVARTRGGPIAFVRFAEPERQAVHFNDRRGDAQSPAPGR